MTGAYEANVKGWLPSVAAGDHVTADPAFGYLKANGVYFYDDGASLTYVPRKPLPEPTVGEPVIVPAPEEVY